MCRYATVFVLVTNWWILICLRNVVNADEFYSDIINIANDKPIVWYQRASRDTNQGNVSFYNLDCVRPDVYICEVPPIVVPPDTGKACNYRSIVYHEQVYRWVAGRGCLLYTPDFLYAAGYNNLNLNTACVYGSFNAPCLELPKEDGTCGCFPFDPGLEEVALAVREALIPSAHGRWERCFDAASDCCSQYMLGADGTNNSGKCDTTFDGWTCWQAADAGTVASEVCSEFAYSNVGPSCHHFSSKECYADGTWELQTDYSTCSIAPRLLRRYRFHIAMLAFSTASCLPAVIIFFFYKRLRITRVALHRNLLIAIIVRNVLVIVSRSEIYIDELTNSVDTVLSTHGTACKVLSVAERIAVNAIFVCMLVEGIYLHRLIVAVFRQKLKVKWLYAVGAVLAVVPVAAWAGVMSVYDDHSCWLIYTKANIQWILDAPRIAILLVNTVLFADVLRVLLTKIRNAENANQLNTAKATLFLMPLFGTHFLLTAFRPNTSNCSGEQAYYYVAYSVEGLQGFVVSMLYCYVNKEVHMLLKATYKKTETAVVSRVRRDSNYPRMSIDPKSDRRLTYSTGLSQNNNETKDHAANTPKLHVAEIISIQDCERLADILEPAYATIENGVVNDGYDSFEKSSADNDSGIIANTIPGNNYNSVINNNDNTYNSDINNSDDTKRNVTRPIEKLLTGTEKRLSHESIQKSGSKTAENLCKDELDANSFKNDEDSYDDIDESMYEDCENMLHEIMQYVDTNEDPIKLDPDVLTPNRKDGDKIIFLDDLHI